MSRLSTGPETNHFANRETLHNRLNYHNRKKLQPPDGRNYHFFRGLSIDDRRKLLAGHALRRRSAQNLRAPQSRASRQGGALLRREYRFSLETPHHNASPRSAA